MLRTILQLRFSPSSTQFGSIPSHGKRFMANLPGQSSKNRYENYYLRQRRKWPLSDYKAEWDKKFCQQLAMDNLKKSVKSVSKTPTAFPALLLDSFSAYECKPTPSAYRFIIRAMTKTKSIWDQIPVVLDQLQKDENFEIPESAFIDLIKFYGNSDMLEAAIQLFYDIPKFRCKASVESLNALLVVVCEREKNLGFVPGILIRSSSMNIRMEESTFRILIRALCKIGRYRYAIDLVRCIVNEGNVLDESTYSMIVSKMCSGKGSGKDEIFGFIERMMKCGVSPREVDWCNVFHYIVKNGTREDALEVFNMMKTDEVEPNVSCYNLLLESFVNESLYREVDDLFDNMLVSGVVPDIYTYNVYISGLCKQNKLQEGVQMLASMEQLGCRPDVGTYNIVLKGMCVMGKLNMAKGILRQMRVKGMDINMQTCEIIIGGMVSEGDFEDAFDFLKEKVGNCSGAHSVALDKMIQAFCLRVSLDKAVEVVQLMVQKNIAPGVKAWEALLNQFKFSDSSLSIIK